MAVGPPESGSARNSDLSAGYQPPSSFSGLRGEYQRFIGSVLFGKSK